MQKKGFFDRFKILSRPTGRPQWIKALWAMILVVLAVIVSKFLGWDNGINAIMFLTLIATMILDIPLPLRKIVPLAFIGLFMTVLAFISSSLALTSLLAFLFFTAAWAFFSLSTYIFGETVGSFGFMFFSIYFLSALMVNKDANTLNWALYSVLSFAVGSLILIPRVWKGKRNMKEMVASGFNPKTSLESVLAIRHALSGIPLKSRDYELFRLGTYLTGFRGFAKILKSRLKDEYLTMFEEFLKSANITSSKIAKTIINNQESVSMDEIDRKISIIDKMSNKSGEKNLNTFLNLAHQMKGILEKASELVGSAGDGETLTIKTQQTSLREVLSANFNLENIYIRHAIRFSLAMTISLVVVYFTHNRDAIWVTMGVLMIIKPDITSTIDNMTIRLTFNYIAIIIAIILGFLFPHQILIWLGFLMLYFFRAFIPNYMGFSVMALTLFIVLIWPGAVYENALARMIDITIGAVIALICAYFILPKRMTFSLPEQVAKTIQANLEFAESILVAKLDDYDHEVSSSKFGNYMLAESNLKASIKKIQDFFVDVNEDLNIYQELGALNRKLAADLSAIATLIEESDDPIPDLSTVSQLIKKTLNKLIYALKEGIKPSEVSFDKLTHDHEQESFPTAKPENMVTENFEQFIEWIYSDISYLEEQINIGVESEALTRYTKLR